ncbi:MAG: hypothetical protein FWG59_07055 [Betaproteobacteria bacterium]|nr:hypothetical protein [Betaproteobacteria bacterium]
MNNYKDFVEKVEEITSQDIKTLKTKVKASVDAEIIAEALAIPQKYRPYFLQTKNAMRGLGITLNPSKSFIGYPGEIDYAIILQKGDRDLEEKEAYDVFRKIRRRLEAKKLPTFDWKGRVFLRWSPDPSDDSSYETLRYEEGKAYYVFHVDK